MISTEYVYILSTYQEDGAENGCATLDRDLLPLILEQFFKPSPFERKSLYELLKSSDDELENRDAHRLSIEWGGMQLHVVKLIKQEDLMTRGEEL